MPWLELAIVAPLFGALWIAPRRRGELIRWWSVLFAGLAFFCAVGALVDFYVAPIPLSGPRNYLVNLGVPDFFTLDQVTAPLFPLTALLYLLTTLVTSGEKVRRFSFRWTLVSEATVLGALATKEPWLIIALLVAELVPPFLELRSRRRSVRVFAIQAAMFVGLLVSGRVLWNACGSSSGVGFWAVVLQLAAMLIRGGVAPFHYWLTDLFENATFGTALLFVTPLMGAYGALRLVLPIAPAEVLEVVGILSLIMAVYAAGMALVQRESRRFFCFVFLSHSALVFVGLATLSPIALAGGLCLWLSVGLALGGFGLTLRALEARHGRLWLTRYHGIYEHTPALAACFVLTGMASVGFPGTIGFVATELLVDGAMMTNLLVGIGVALAAALNGIAVVKVYFLLFAGTRHQSTVSLRIGWRERAAVLSLAALILGGGIIPQRGVSSRYEAAKHIIEERERGATAGS